MLLFLIDSYREINPEANMLPCELAFLVTERLIMHSGCFHNQKMNYVNQFHTCSFLNDLVRLLAYQVEGYIAKFNFG